MRGITQAVAAIVAVAAVLAAAMVGLKMTDTANYAAPACEAYPITLDTARGQLVLAQDQESRDFWINRILMLASDAEDDGCRQDAAKYLAGFFTAPAPSTTPSATPSSTPTPTATPSAEVPGKGVLTWAPHFFTLDKGKNGKLDFGPPVKGGAKAAAGDKKMLAKLKQQFWDDLRADPVLACANGGLILNGKDGGVPCVKRLMKSKAARDAYLAKVKKAVASMRVEKRYPQWVDSAYQVVGPDGIPRVVAAQNVWRSEVYYVMVVKTKAGKTYGFRLECRWQWDTGKKFVPRVYTPSRHTPYTTVIPCVGGRYRDDNGRCVPPSGGGGNPPRLHHPSPGPSTSTPPSCRNKQCETAVAVLDRAKPSTAPKRNAETTASTESNPATTATATTRAKDTTESEKQSDKSDDDGSQKNAKEVGDPGN